MPQGIILQRWPLRRKLIVFLTASALSGVTFLSLDWLYSLSILKATSNTGPTCRLPDPIRHHAFQTKCGAFDHWGGDSYSFFTNSLGFRDERIRQVPLEDALPRVLLLGDSFTEGKCTWRDTYVGRIAAHFSQYDFLNGGVSGYSPSNYLNVGRMLLAEGVTFDEAIVFIDISDAQDEAAFYRDIDTSGAVTGPARELWITPRYSRFRLAVTRHFLLSSYILEFFESVLVRHGYYHLSAGQAGNVFDEELSAWTYRKVSDTDPREAGYAPLGLEGGIAKEKKKMTLLWEELAQRQIPVSVVVYPWPAQVIHDTANSRQVQIWREWCEGKCKRFISLFPAFLAERDQCPRSQPGCWYLKNFVFGDVHYNSAGNAIVAQAVINSLMAVPPNKAATINATSFVSKPPRQHAHWPE